jgi:murein tripeptide amidase MpaA
MPTTLVHRYSLGRTPAGVDIPVLHISNHEGGEHSKKNILVVARAHPGESNSSHVLKGLMEGLCSGDEWAVQLRERTNFVIVPMVNPDGVILGNSRSGTAGKDLNRQYLSPHK